MVGRGFDDFDTSVGVDGTVITGVSSSFDKSIVSFSLIMGVGVGACDCCTLGVDGDAETFFDIMLTELFICNF